MDDIEVDVETVRVQLMKAEWPHGGHGTLDQTTAALSRILTRLRTANVSMERDMAMSENERLYRDNRRMHLLYEIVPPQRNAVALMDRYKDALERIETKLSSGEFGFNERTVELQDIARAALSEREGRA
jgi:hypothetical protein